MSQQILIIKTTNIFDSNIAKITDGNCPKLVAQICINKIVDSFVYFIIIPLEIFSRKFNLNYKKCSPIDKWILLLVSFDIFNFCEFGLHLKPEIASLKFALHFEKIISLKRTNYKNVVLISLYKSWSGHHNPIINIKK